MKPASSGGNRMVASGAPTAASLRPREQEGDAIAVAQAEQAAREPRAVIAYQQEARDQRADHHPVECIDALPDALLDHAREGDVDRCRDRKPVDPGNPGLVSGDEGTGAT